jgi:hypothetical protein
MFTLLYPERRTVSPETILTWYRDAVANGELEDMGDAVPAEAAFYLHDAGLITLANSSYVVM